jgi:hypothetical protein
MAFVTIGKPHERYAINIDKIYGVSEQADGNAKIIYGINTRDIQGTEYTDERFDDFMNKIAYQQQLEGKIKIRR